MVEGGLADGARTQARRMEGCVGVVHAAAMMYGGKSLSAAEGVNVEGTRRVLEGAMDAGVKNAVHISSVTVYGEVSGPICEKDPLHGALRDEDFYARTKREAEETAFGLHGQCGLAVTVLRPSALYGERDRWLVPRLATQLKRGFVPLVGRGLTRFPAVYAGNAAQAVEQALLGRGGGEAFNIAEDHPVTLRALFGGLARVLDLEPRFVRIPAAVARMSAGVGEVLGLGVPGARDLSLRRTVRLASDDNPYSSEKARTLLGWSPPFTVEEAMARTGAWIRERDGQDGARQGRG